MRKRQLIVNRNFQVNIALTFTLITAVTMAVIIMIISTVLIINNRSIEGIINNQQVISKTDREILNTLFGLASKKNAGNIHLSTSELLEDSQRSKVLIDQNVSEIKKISNRNIILIIILIISVIIQSIIIFYLALKRSHRILGPIFLLNRYINDLRNGNYPEIRSLRDKDDFKDLFENFRVLAGMINMK